MILALNAVRKAFLDETILEDASFQLAEGEKAALVGPNGAGKTTLFRLITGELSVDSGDIIVKKGIRLGYLKQVSDLVSDTTVYRTALSSFDEVTAREAEMRAIEAELEAGTGDNEALLLRHDRLLHEFEAAGGYAMKSEVTGLLKGLGFPESDFEKPVRLLSGGEKTRLSLVKLLLEKPECLLLDEPTNHLDLSGIAFLEGVLTTYPGAVLVVSHDRYFLDRVVKKVIDLDHGRTRTYTGNYSAFAEKKRALREAEMRAYESYEKEVARQKAIIERYRSFNREQFYVKAASREKAIERMTPVDRPTADPKSMRLRFTPAVQSGKDVLNVTDLSFGFGARTLFSDVNFEIKRGEKIALIGDNGVGKTTLLRLLTHELSPKTGRIRFGTEVHIGYFDQAHQVLHPEKTVFEEIQDTYPRMDNTAVRTHLGAFLFSGDDVFKRIKELSGGEQGRVSLAKLMLSDANLLFLDEPTNHLDTGGKEVLEDAIRGFEGTVIAVSHDRYFIRAFADRILEIRDGAILDFHGSFDEYWEKRPLLLAKPEDEAEAPQVSEAKLLWASKKEADAKTRKLARERERLEAEIDRLTNEIDLVDEEMAKPENASDAVLLGELAAKKDALDAALLEAYEAWEKLTE